MDVNGFCGGAGEGRDVVVSFVLPVFNVVDYVWDCLESVLGQRDFDGCFEIIVVDDGSTDGSLEVCREFVARYGDGGCESADERGGCVGVRLLEPGHGGPSWARNCGLEAARGRYVAFVDSDDLLSPWFAAVMCRAIEGVDMACCGFMRDASVRWRRPGFLDGCAGGSRVLSGRDAVEEMLYQCCNMVNSSPWCKLYRRDVIGDRRFWVGHIYEDLDWLPGVMLAAVNGICVVNEPLYMYRVNVGSLLCTVSRNRLDALVVTERIERAMIETGDRGLIRAAGERRMSAAFNMMELFVDDADVVSQCWAIIRRERWHSLMGRRVRLKSRCGALLALLLGRRLLTRVLRVRASGVLCRR